MTKPRGAGLRGSKPVSRILSWVTILLCGYPAPRRAASTEPVRLAPDGVWLAAVSPRRWWALTPPFHPYLRQINRRAGKAATTPNGIASEAVERYASGGLLSVPLSVGFRRLGRPSVLPCGVRTFLERLSAPAVTRPAPWIVASLRRPPGSPRRTPDRRSRPDGAARTHRRRGIPGSRRGAARAPPGRASGSRASGSKGAEHAGHLADDLHVIGVDRLERRVLGLQPDPPALVEEALDRRLVDSLVCTGQPHADVAVLGALLPLHDDDVSVADPRLAHRVALHAY